MARSNCHQPIYAEIIKRRQHETLPKNGGWVRIIPIFGGPPRAILRIIPKSQGFWFGTTIATYQIVRCQVAHWRACMTDVRTPRNFLGNGLKVLPIRGVPPAEQIPTGDSISEGIILEASDWLLGAEGRLPGRGDGPTAFGRSRPPYPFEALFRVRVWGVL